VGLTGLTGQSDRSDQCATTQSGIFEEEDTHRDRKACVEAKQVAVAGHPSDGESFKSSKTALDGLVSVVVREGYLDFRLPPYNPRGERMAANSWNPSSFAFLFSLPIFLGFQ
jgi:hypothetical protein